MACFLLFPIYQKVMRAVLTQAMLQLTRISPKKFFDTKHFYSHYNCCTSDSSEGRARDCRIYRHPGVGGSSPPQRTIFAPVIVLHDYYYVLKYNTCTVLTEVRVSTRTSTRMLKMYLYPAWRASPLSYIKKL